MPTSLQVLAKATSVASDYRKRGVRYVMGADASDGGSTSDCSHFVHDVLSQVGLTVPYTTTRLVASSPYFTSVDQATAKAGDVIVQGQHMGIYTGDADAKKHPLGVQMGNHGTANAPWGPGGWFAQPNDLRFYRIRGVM